MPIKFEAFFAGLEKRRESRMLLKQENLKHESEGKCPQTKYGTVIVSATVEEKKGVSQCGPWSGANKRWRWA